jgi:hypothetical protein
MAKPRKGSGRLQILHTPRATPTAERQRKLHRPDCRWAFRPTGRIRAYRDATPEEIRTHERCSYC